MASPATLRHGLFNSIVIPTASLISVAPERTPQPADRTVDLRLLPASFVEVVFGDAGAGGSLRTRVLASASDPQLLCSEISAGTI